MTTALDLLDDLDEVLGENAEATSIRGWLDSGIPELNRAMGGHYSRGFPMGRVMEVFGEESSGKTFIATMAMISAQAQEGIAFFADHERSFSPEFAESLGLNLNPSAFRHFKPMTVEESIDKLVQVARVVRKKLPMEVPCVWVIDSIASMIPAEVLYKKDGKGKRTEDIKSSEEYNMRDNMALAAATSKTFKLLKVIAEDYNFTVIMLNQTRTDPNVMFGNPLKTPGGKTPAFVADIRISLGKKLIKDKETKETTGFEVTAKAIKNKIYKPDCTGHWFVSYLLEGGTSIDQFATNVDYAVRKGALTKTGTRVEWRGKKMYESQLVEWLRTNEEDYQALLDLITKESESDA